MCAVRVTSIPAQRRAARRFETGRGLLLSLESIPWMLVYTALYIAKLSNGGRTRSCSSCVVDRCLGATPWRSSWAGQFSGPAPFSAWNRAICGILPVLCARESRAKERTFGQNEVRADRGAKGACPAAGIAYVCLDTLILARHLHDGLVRASA
jgi:hypothetical protein